MLAASADFEFFTARSNGDKVRIEWRLESEDNVKYYVIEKYIERINNFKFLKKVDPEGQGSTYTHLDEDIFFKEYQNDPSLNESQVQQYRIKVVFNDGTSSYSDVSFVTHNVSSVRKTWGMLKEMFR